MRLTVISHSCVVDTNQQLFAQLEQLGVVVQLIVPALWKGDLAGTPLKPRRWEHLQTQLVEQPVVLSGNVPLHAYRASLGRQFYLFQPDAIYVENESYAVSTFQAALANQLSVRRPFLFRNNQNIFKRYPPPFSRLERYVLDHAACANVVNQDAGQVLRTKGYRGRIAYMPYGVDTKFYQPVDVRALKRERGLRGTVYGYMGRLVPEKGLMDLIGAFERFHPEEDVSLLIVGNGPLKSEIEVRLASPGLQGRAFLMPAVEHREVPTYLSLMTTLVLPSRTLPAWKEQFGRVVIEALACGVPVIGSDSGEIPNLVNRLQAGLIYPEGDVVALHGAMRRLIEIPGKHDGLRELGRREVEQQYDHTALAYRFRQLLEALVADRHRGGSNEELPSWVYDH